MSSTQVSSEKIGGINEQGLLSNMTKEGFNPEKCLLELFANSLDSFDRLSKKPAAFQPIIVCDLTDADYISILDNAAGMNRENAKGMAELNRENHREENSRGVAGKGGKYALRFLSNESEVEIFTHSINAEYLKLTIPWGDILKRNQYTGMSEIREMNEEERRYFTEKLTVNGMVYGQKAHGTILRFKYNEVLASVLTKNFGPVVETTMKDLLDRASLVFGCENVKIFLKKDTGSQELKLYDYFGATNNQYYEGKSEYTITQWYKPSTGENKFVLIDGDKEYVVGSSKGKKETKLSVVEKKSNLQGFDPIGDIHVRVGLRKDTDYFNTEAPKKPGASGAIYTYDSGFLGTAEPAREYLTSYKLRRNNTLIGPIAEPDIAKGSTRANFDSNLEHMRVQLELYYNPVSSHDNLQDRILGIQANKHQYNGIVPKELTLLLKHIRKMKADKIKKYMDDVIVRYEKEQEALRVVHVEESDKDGDEELNDQETKSEDQNKNSSEDNQTTNDSPAADEEQPMPVEEPKVEEKFSKTFTLEFANLDSDSCGKLEKSLKLMMKKYNGKIVV